MRFQAYLAEGRELRTYNIDEQAFRSILNERCFGTAQDLIDGKYAIYRGTQHSGDFLYGSGSDFAPRESANTDNYYTWWIDNRPEWSKFPKRSLSFICADTKRNAGSYGEVYGVIPFDSTKVGICNSVDMWSSFLNLKNMHVDADDFNRFLSVVFGKGKKPKSYQELITILKNNTHLAKDTTYYDSYEKFYDAMSEILRVQAWGMQIDKFELVVKKWWELKSLYKLAEYAWNSRGFDTFTAGSGLGVSKPDYSEYWMEGPCLFLNCDEGSTTIQHALIHGKYLEHK